MRVANIFLIYKAQHFYVAYFFHDLSDDILPTAQVDQQSRGAKLNFVNERE